jgi:hypothetical protein
MALLGPETVAVVMSQDPPMVHPVEAHDEVVGRDGGPCSRVKWRIADERDAGVRAAAAAPLVRILGKQPAQPDAQQHIWCCKIRNETESYMQQKDVTYVVSPSASHPRTLHACLEPAKAEACGMRGSSGSDSWSMSSCFLTPATWLKHPAVASCSACCPCKHGEECCVTDR